MEAIVYLCAKNHSKPMFSFHLVNTSLRPFQICCCCCCCFQKPCIKNRLVMVINFNVSLFRYDVMTRCWNLNPDFRPPFENLRKRMDTYLREEVCSDESINNRGELTEFYGLGSKTMMTIIIIVEILIFLISKKFRKKFMTKCDRKSSNFSF